MSQRKALMLWLIGLVLLQIVVNCVVLISLEPEPATDAPAITARS